MVLPFVPVMPATRRRDVGLAVEARGCGRHRRPGVLDEDLGHAETERTLDHERHRAALHGLRGEVVPVALEAADAEEQRPGPRLAAVVGETGDLDVGGALAHHLAQVHAAPESREA